MLSVTGKASEAFRRSLAVRKCEPLDDVEFEDMISICKSNSNPSIWEMEVLYLPKDMPVESLVTHEGVTFYHPGDIASLDIEITFENWVFLIDGEKVELT